MMKKLWAKITRKGDEKAQYPIQQGTYLGKVTDFMMLFPFGMHANVPPDQLGLVIDEQGRVFMATSAIGRIVVEEGEVVFYHPKTKSKLHFKDNGDVEVDAKANVVITTTDANITAAGDVNITAENVNIDASVTNLGVGGSPIARAGDPVSVTVTSGSSAGTYAGTITSGGSNTSI